MSSPRPAYFLCFTVVGLGMAMAGPSLTHLRHQVGADVAAGGVIVASLSVGYIAASLVVGRFLDRGAGHRLLLAAGAVAVAAVLASELATTLLALGAVLAVLGASGGVIDVSCNTLLVWNEPPGQAGSALNALHLCFGLGAIASPLIVAASLELTGGLTLLAAAIAVVVVVVAVLLRTRPAPTPRVHDHDAPPPDGQRPKARGAHRTRVLSAAAVFFVLYVAAEGTFASWAATYAESLDLGVAQGPALLTAVFWVGFSLGRVTAVVVTRTRPVEPLLIGTCLAATAAAAALWLADGSTAATWAITAILGFSLGPQYATMLAAADHRVGLDGRSTSLLVGLAGVGGLLGPLVTGVILDRRGVDLLPLVVGIAVFGSTAAAALAVADRVDADHQGDP